MTEADIRELLEEKNQLVRDNWRLLNTLKRIGEWDCLNPPATHLVADLLWLRQLVDTALQGYPGERPDS